MNTPLPRRRTRLDSFIARLMAQRDCLDFAAGLIAGLHGPILEIGLGNGRTFDHLRALFPDREIFVFDRVKQSHPGSTPDDAHFFLGDLRDTLPTARRRIGRPAALAHCDAGDSDPERATDLARFMGETLPTLLAPDAIVLADRPLPIRGATPLTLPASVPPQRYFGWRVAAA